MSPWQRRVVPSPVTPQRRVNTRALFNSIDSPLKLSLAKLASSFSVIDILPTARSCEGAVAGSSVPHVFIDHASAYLEVMPTHDPTLQRPHTEGPSAERVEYVEATCCALVKTFHSGPRTSTASVYADALSSLLIPSACFPSDVLAGHVS